MIDIYEQMNIEENAYDSGHESAKFLYEEQIAQLISQRDALLAVLKMAISNTNGNPASGYLNIPCSTVQNMLEAIIEVEGKK